MAEGGFDPEEMEMNEISLVNDEQPSLNTSRDITENETDFSQDGSSMGGLDYKAIEGFRNKFKSKYNIDDETFDELRKNLIMIDDKLYYKGRNGSGDPVNVLIEGIRTKVYALRTIENMEGGTRFACAIEMFELSRPGARTKVQNQPKQPVEPTVVNRQPIEHEPIDKSFDNPVFDDEDDDELTQRLTDFRTINEDLEATGEPPLDSYRTPGIPQKS